MIFYGSEVDSFAPSFKAISMLSRFERGDEYFEMRDVMEFFHSLAFLMGSTTPSMVDRRRNAMWVGGTPFILAALQRA